MSIDSLLLDSSCLLNRTDCRVSVYSMAVLHAQKRLGRFVWLLKDISNFIIDCVYSAIQDAKGQYIYIIKTNESRIRSPYVIADYHDKISEISLEILEVLLKSRLIFRDFSLFLFSFFIWSRKRRVKRNVYAHKIALELLFNIFLNLSEWNFKIYSYLENFFRIVSLHFSLFFFFAFFSSYEYNQILLLDSCKT